MRKLVEIQQEAANVVSDMGKIVFNYKQAIDQLSQKILELEVEAQAAKKAEDSAAVAAKSE